MTDPLCAHDPANFVNGEERTIGFGLIKLLMSHNIDSISDLCISTLSTTTNLFQGNHNVLFTVTKGDLSKRRVIAIPPIVTRSKLKEKKYRNKENIR